MLGNSENRIKREKEFHDQRFTNDQREVLAPIYTFANYSKSFFENIVTNIKPEDNVLEIGCGINSISKKIIDKGANVTIIDISEKAIEIAKREFLRYELNASFFVMNAENLKFNEKTFDLIYGIGILHHLSIENSITEIKKVLKKGGKAVFYEPLGHNLFINIFRNITPNLRSKDEHPLLVKDLEMIKSNFSKTKLYYFHFFSLLTIPLVYFPLLIKLIYLINVIDNKLLKVFPLLKKYCWISIVEIKS